MATTTNLGMPLLEQAQANKEVTINEGLTILDGVAGLVVQAGDLASRPAGFAGMLYYVTDAGAERLTRHTGAGWQDVAIDWDYVTGRSISNADVAPAAGIAESKLALNFPTHSNANDPTADEKLALAGSSGAPGALNPYVTSADPRLTHVRAFNVMNSTWPSQPAAVTELFGGSDRRTAADLTGHTEARLVANVVVSGAAGATLRAEYSTDGATWQSLDHGTGPEVAIDATGLVVSPWVTLNGAAAADVFLRLVGVGGDGVASPSMGLVELHHR